MNPCTVEPSGVHAFALGSFTTGPVCIHCSLSYAHLSATASPAAPTPPSSPARQPFYGTLNALPPAVKLPPTRMQWGEFGYPETAPAPPGFDEVRLAAMEEKCPGAGFTVEGHKARKGTVEYVDAGVVQVFCDKCRVKVIVFLAT